MNVAYLYALPMAELQGVTRVAERAATALVGAGGARFVALTVVISTLGCNNAAILACVAAAVRDGARRRVPAVGGAVHPRYRTPHIAIVALAAWSPMLALSGSYEQLFTYVMFASNLLHTIGAIGALPAAAAAAGSPRPYRVWGYPGRARRLHPGVGASVQHAGGASRESFAGLGFLALGLPVYWYSKRGASATFAVRNPNENCDSRIRSGRRVLRRAAGARGARRHFIARGAHLAAIRERGLEIRSAVLGDFVARARAEEDSRASARSISSWSR